MSQEVGLIQQQWYQDQQRAMMILGGWAVGNLASGIVGMSQREGSDKAFHQMNAGWGAINLTLAGLGYWSALQGDPQSFSGFEALQAQHRLQKIFLFNTALDVGYMLGGLWMIERSKNVSSNADRWKGFGQSIILQGAFLFAFDLICAIHFNPDSAVFQSLLSQLDFTPTGVRWSLNF